MGERTGGELPKVAKRKRGSGNGEKTNGQANQPSVASYAVTHDTMLGNMEEGVGAEHYDIPAIEARAVSAPVQTVPEEMCKHMMVTWNMQGCSLAINDVWDVVVQEKPSVVILTEVKRAYTSVKRLGAC